MELRDLKYFQAVAVELHFGRAAARLHVAPASVTQRIRQLERTLGVDLFERTSRRVSLTPAGERLLVSAQEVLAAVLAFERSARSLGSPARDPLNVGFAPNVGPVASELMKALVDASRDREVVGRSLWSHEALEQVRSGELSAAIVRGPVDDHELTTVWLAESVDESLAMSATHPLTRSPSIDLRQLEDRPVLIVERDCAPHVHDATVEFFKVHHVTPAWRPHRVQEYDQIMTLVAADVGVTLVHSHQAAGTYRDVTIRPLAQPGPRYDLNVVYRTADTSAVPELLETIRGRRPPS